MDGANTMEVNGAVSNVVPEAPQVRVPDLERIRNAHKKRMLQIKEWQQYDRKMNRESEKLQRKGLGPVGDKGLYRGGPQVKFPQSLIFLEAAARGDLDEVRSLLSSGVCPDVANEDGLTALHQCCIDNTPEMCRLLLRFGANPNARDTERWTPLHAAATCHHTDLCAILIAHGADLLAMNADGNMPYECCMPGPTLSLIESEMDKRGITQEELDDLHRLPECQMLTDMEALYKAGADFNVLDKQGASMLHIAAACGYEEVTIFLLKHGAKIDQLDRDGWQAIHIAACWEHMEIIEILVNFGADIMAQTTSGETVFDICDDLEMHARLMEIKEEFERKQFQQQDAQNRPEKPRELIRRRSSTNPRSASIRRTSMREKKMISWKEAKQEAEMRGVGGLNLADGDLEPTTPSSASRTEISADRRVNSPLTVNTSNNPMQQPSVRGSSSTVLPVSPTESGKQPSNPLSPPIATSNVQSTDVMQSPRPKRTLTSSSNGITTHKGNDAATVGGATRLQSKSSERNSNKPLRSDKRVSSPEPPTQFGFKRGTMDNEHKPNRRTSTNHPASDATFTPTPQPRTTSRPTGMNTDHSSHQITLSPPLKTRNHVIDRHPDQASMKLRNSSPSPILGHRSSTQSRRSKVSDSAGPGRTEPTLPNLSAHNAYYNPTQDNQIMSTGVIAHQTGTLRSNQNRQLRVNNSSIQSEHDTVRTATLPRKFTRELIESDSDYKASGKCCLVM